MNDTVPQPEIARSALERALQVGGEAAICLLFRVGLLSARTQLEDRIPLDPAADTVVSEMKLRYGRADIVIFHHDGTASVIEVKDGTKGYAHVVAGIGQAGLYAVQLAQRNTLSKIRRCLLWTSTGSLACDALIEQACDAAQVIPLPWGALRAHLDATATVLAEAA